MSIFCRYEMCFLFFETKLTNRVNGSNASANISPTPQPGVVYFLDDHQGNTHLVTDSIGNIVHEESRYPYGAKRYDQNLTDSSDAVSESKPYYSYTGKEYDEETGLVYFGGRYYAPELGRWITPDPLFLEKEPQKILEMPQELNSYGYVKNNPMSAVDEEGLETVYLFGAPITLPDSVARQMKSDAQEITATYGKVTVGATALSTAVIAAPLAMEAGAAVAALEAWHAAAAWKMFELGTKVVGAYNAAQAAYYGSQVIHGAFGPEAPKMGWEFAGSSVSYSISIDQRYKFSETISDSLLPLQEISNTDQISAGDM